MSVALRSSIVASLAASTLCAAQTTRQTQPETWAATDALGRRIEPSRYRASRDDRFVGIFYFLWLQGGPGKQVFDLTKLSAAEPAAPKFGPVGAFHWWGEPYFGYYRSDDEWVIAKHAQMLGDAGVDVVFFDVTNAITYDATLATVCDVFAKLRAAGRRTPQVAFLTHSKSAQTVTHLYETFYKPRRHEDLWFKWRGKPLLLATDKGLAPEVAAFFTLRESWAWTDPKGWFGDGRGKWPWLDSTPQKYGWIDAKDKPEEIAVAVAQHPVTPIGRSYHAGKQPPADQLRTADGLYFAEQWDRAIEVDPQFVFVTGWNEWIAQRFLSDGKAPKAVGYSPLKKGDTFFVDTYSQEFSRDIEPMAGGHGDDYYYQLVDGIRRFKGARAAPPARGPTTIDLAAGFAQWGNVGPVFVDDAGDTAPRDAEGYDPTTRLTNTTGRNDFVECRVAYDRENVYFYARTAAPLTPPAADGNWMTLLIDERPGERNSWSGYTLAINRVAPKDGRATVERFSSTTNAWTPAGEARIAHDGAALQLAVPRPLVAGSSLRFDFKWIDHVAPEGDPIRLIDHGDAAPNGRFNYQFRAAP